jgi:hypothetical protein
MASDEIDWVSLLELIDALSNTIVKYYKENKVKNREVGLEALIVLAHLTRSSISEVEPDFDKFLARCISMSLEVQSVRDADTDSTNLKN